MFDLNERYSDVAFQILVVRADSDKGDIPNTSALWNGASGNKMLNTFHCERCSVLFSKYTKTTANPMGNTPSRIQTVGKSFQFGTATISKATRIVKFFVPGKKFIPRERRGSEFSAKILTSRNLFLIVIKKPTSKYIIAGVYQASQQHILQAWRLEQERHPCRF